MNENPYIKRFCRRCGNETETQKEGGVRRGYDEDTGAPIISPSFEYSRCRDGGCRRRGGTDYRKAALDEFGGDL